MTEEFNGFQIFIFSVLVCHPLSILSAVIQIQHRCNRIHTEPIYVVFLNPEKRVGDQEILDLISSVIKDFGTPVRILPFSGICIFISRSAVKVSQSMGLPRTMRRHPVQDDANLVFMHIIDEIFEILRCSVTGSRRIVSGHLISPGSVEGMLCDAHQLYVGIAHFLYIICESMSKLPVIVEAFVFFVFLWMLSPG